MAWPTEVYVATQLNGVYHTTTFTPPADPTQPTWAAVNDGLASLLIRQFAMDPFNQSGRQYCLLTDGTLYKRESGGAWAGILTAAEARTACGVAVGQARTFCCDTNAAGTLYALHTGDLLDIDPYVLKSTDYGGTWTGAKCYTSNTGKTRDYGGIRAHDPYVFIGWCGHSLARGLLIYSTTAGVSWATPIDLYSSSWAPWVYPLPPSAPGTAYHRGHLDKANCLARYVVGSGDSQLTTGFPQRLDSLVCHAADPQQQARVSGQYVYHTTDEWAHVAASAELTVSSLIAVAAASPTDLSALLLGADQYDDLTASEEGVAVYAYDAVSGTLTAKAGANPTSSPYTGSIPYNSGPVAWDGVQPVGISPGHWHVYSCRYEEAS